MTEEIRGKVLETLGVITVYDITVYEELTNPNAQAATDFLADSSKETPERYSQMNILDASEHGKYAVERMQQNIEILRKDGVAEPIIGVLNMLQKYVYAKNSLVYHAHWHQLTRDIAMNRTAQDERNEAEIAWLAECERQIMEGSRILYGEPDREVFEGLLAQELSRLQQSRPQCEEMRTLNEIFSKQPPRPSRLYEPRTETLQRFKEIAEIFFENLWRFVPDGQAEFTAAEVLGVMRGIFADINDGAPIEKMTKYRAEISGKATFLSVNHQERLAKIPIQRAAGPYTAKVLKEKVLAHEIGVHTLKPIPYEFHEIKALSIGLPGYEEVEEGLATAIEQALAGKFSPARPLRYIAIGLAYFYKKNFREVHEILWRLMFVEELRDDMSESAIINKRYECRKKAFAETERVFRGTGTLPFLKDLIYYRGNIAVWKYIEAHLDDPEQLMFDLFLSGKINPFNQLQAQFVYEAHVDGSMEDDADLWQADTMTWKYLEAWLRKPGQTRFCLSAVDQETLLNELTND